MVAVMISRPSPPRTTGPGPSTSWTSVPRVRSAVESHGQVGKVPGICPHSVDPSFSKTAGSVAKGCQARQTPKPAGQEPGHRQMSKGPA